jgi:putative spermidine/putrescine transport system substrate-binding protein
MKHLMRHLMQHLVKRGRSVGVATAACVLLAITACERPHDTHPLTVVGWGGSSQSSEQRAYYAPFSAETGIAVREDSWHGGVGIIRTKVRGGDTSWDVVEVETEDLILGCEEQLFEPIDWGSLGGRESFIAAAVHDCGVGSVQWSYVIGYDADRFPRGGPATWADFWNVLKFPGKRGMRKTPKYTLEIALLADGAAPRDVYRLLRTPQGIDRAFHKLDELKPYAIWWTSISQVPDLLASGEVTMSVASPGRLIVADRTDGKHFRTSWQGNIYAVDYWAILKNSPRTAQAMQFIRYATRPQSQLRLAALIPTGVTSRSAAASASPAMRAETPTDPLNMVNSLELDAGFWVEYGDQLTQQFNAWVSHP